MTRVARMTWPVDMAVDDSRLGGCRSVQARRSTPIGQADVRPPGEGLGTLTVDQSSGEGSILVSGAGPGGAAYFIGSASLVASKTDSSLVLSKIICSRDSPVKS